MGSQLHCPCAGCTNHPLQRWCRAGRATSHPSMSQDKFGPFPQPWTAEHTKPEALQAPSGKKKKSCRALARAARVGLPQLPRWDSKGTIIGCDQQCQAGKKYPCIIIISILLVSLETCHCACAEGRGHHTHQAWKQHLKGSL